jgi:hypothetical protein
MADEQHEQVFRLTEIDTHEVSIVDAAANGRKFLIQKSKGVGTMKAGAQIVSDGKGGHTVSKDTPPAPGAPAPAAAPPAPAAPAAGGPTAEPIIALSPEMKAELAKRVAAAEGRLTALKALLEKATETAGLVEIPAEISTMVGLILAGLAHGETTEKGEVQKGLPQFSSSRTAQLVAARDALDAVISGVVKPAPVEPDPAAEPAPAADGEIAKAIAKALAPLEEKLAKALEKIATTVGLHGAAIEKQAGRVELVEKGSRPTPRSGAPDGSVEKSTGESDDATEPNGSWPADMSDPDRHDVKKAKPDVRFTVEKR